MPDSLECVFYFECPTYAFLVLQDEKPTTCFKLKAAPNVFGKDFKRASLIKFDKVLPEIGDWPGPIKMATVRNPNHDT